MSLWMGEAKIHELYTAACGLYICWLMLRIGTVLYNWIPQGTAVILNKLKEWLILVRKSVIYLKYMGESFQGYSKIQNFEADFPCRTCLKKLNKARFFV